MGKGLDLEAKPPRIKFCWVPSPPGVGSAQFEHLHFDGVTCNVRALDDFSGHTVKQRRNLTLDVFCEGTESYQSVRRFLNSVLWEGGQIEGTWWGGFEVLG